MHEEEARTALLDCCGSALWADTMVSHRPFRGESQLLDTADKVWWQLSEGDWREAFACHPQIGAHNSHRLWSQQEQAGMQSAADATRSALAELNRAYLENFGYTYIVCASGKSGEEMLAILKKRLENDPATEIRIAAEEQSKITKLRLRKMLSH